ncbi:MAG: hypothetical protein A3I73_06035 [Omnitrophica bacterium RIFCSPLOWO2_02_FULL_45_16]|nr:MAG: hypothetical protein A3C51_01740 [Omnitrophica bacterium RIFCSPHIGHO2_02_FULL_46_20]OGX01112.1 MAG: hypothetical protein A3I73_06035 [Omnitrophica bacterium RIFCSPLOWO2_02_FULL_45_16]
MNNHQWDKIRKFESRYKEKSLRRMSEKKSLGIFLDMYQFSQKILDKKYYFSLDPVKVRSLIRKHSIAGKVRQ